MKKVWYNHEHFGKMKAIELDRGNNWIIIQLREFPNKDITKRVPKDKITRRLK